MSLQRAISRNADLRQVYVSLDTRLNNIFQFISGMVDILEECNITNPKLEKLTISMGEELTRIENEFDQTE